MQQPRTGCIESPDTLARTPKASPHPCSPRFINVTHLVEVFATPCCSSRDGRVQRCPRPCETGLIAAGRLRPASGKLQIELVIASGLSRRSSRTNRYQSAQGGRWLERPGLHRQRQQVLITGEPFFKRHGPKVLRALPCLGVLVAAPRYALALLRAWNALGGSAGRRRSACSLLPRQTPRAKCDPDVSPVCFCGTALGGGLSCPSPSSPPRCRLDAAMRSRRGGVLLLQRTPTAESEQQNPS